MSKPDGSKPDATANRARLARLVDERCSGTLEASANEELHALLAGSEDLRRSY